MCLPLFGYQIVETMTPKKLNSPSLCLREGTDWDPDAGQRVSFFPRKLVTQSDTVRPLTRERTRDNEDRQEHTLPDPLILPTSRSLFKQKPHVQIPKIDLYLLGPLPKVLPL